MNQETTHYRKVLISEELPELLQSILINGPYHLKDVLQKLSFATDYLLHVKDYDGGGHEEILYALNEAKKVINVLENTHSDKFKIEPYSPKEEAVRFVEWLNSLETLDLTQFKDPANPTASELYDKFKQESK